MKNIILALIFISAISINAQDNLVWLTDMKKAIEISKSENKPLFLFFTGSDWCGWCIRLQKEVFRTPEFTEWSKKVVLVDLDFPRSKPQVEAIKMQNQNLAQLLGVRGYPTVWFVKEGVSTDGKSTNLEQLGSTGYVAGGPATWIAGADQIIAKFVPYPVISKKLNKAKKKIVKKKTA